MSFRANEDLIRRALGGCQKPERGEAMSKMEEMLLARYGVLLSLADCAALLDRSVDGLRITLAGRSDIAQQLRPAKIKIGRRVMFKASELAKILEG